MKRIVKLMQRSLMVALCLVGGTVAYADELTDPANGVQIKSLSELESGQYYFIVSQNTDFRHLGSSHSAAQNNNGYEGALGYGSDSPAHVCWVAQKRAEVNLGAVLKLTRDGSHWQIQNVGTRRYFGAEHDGMVDYTDTYVQAQDIHLGSVSGTFEIGNAGDEWKRWVVRGSYHVSNSGDVGYSSGTDNNRELWKIYRLSDSQMDSLRIRLTAQLRELVALGIDEGLVGGLKDAETLAAATALCEGEPTIEEIEDLLDSGIKHIDDGKYYYIISQHNDFRHLGSSHDPAQSYNGYEAALGYSDANGSTSAQNDPRYVKWVTTRRSEPDAAVITRIMKAEDGNWNLYNVKQMKFVGPFDAEVTSGSKPILFSDDKETTQIIAPSINVANVLLCNSDAPSGKCFGIDGSYHVSNSAWIKPNNTRSEWRIYELSADQLQQLCAPFILKLNKAMELGIGVIGGIRDEMSYAVVEALLSGEPSYEELAYAVDNFIQPLEDGFYRINSVGKEGYSIYSDYPALRWAQLDEEELSFAFQITRSDDGAYRVLCLNNGSYIGGGSPVKISDEPVNIYINMENEDDPNGKWWLRNSSNGASLHLNNWSGNGSNVIAWWNDSHLIADNQYNSFYLEMLSDNTLSDLLKASLAKIADWPLGTVGGPIDGNAANALISLAESSRMIDYDAYLEAKAEYTLSLGNGYWRFRNDAASGAQYMSVNGKATFYEYGDDDRYDYVSCAVSPDDAATDYATVWAVSSNGDGTFALASQGLYQANRYYTARPNYALPLDHQSMKYGHWEGTTKTWVQISKADGKFPDHPYIMKCPEADRRVNCYYSLGGGEETLKWTIEAAKEITVNLAEAADSYWTTLYLPFSISLPEGTEAYIANVEGGELTLESIGHDIPAATPVIVNSDTDVISAKINTQRSTFNKDNSLSGEYLAGGIEEEGFLAFAIRDGKPGFYPTDEANRANVAYISSDLASPQGYDIDPDDLTGVVKSEKITENRNNNGEVIYDIFGRKISNLKPQTSNLKGIYIQNGKLIKY